MPDDHFSAMRQSIIDGAPETASSLAQEAVASSIPPIDAINKGFIPACMTSASSSPTDKCFSLT